MDFRMPYIQLFDQRDDLYEYDTHSSGYHPDYPTGWARPWESTYQPNGITSWPASVLTAPGSFHLKHSLADIPRVDSGLSLSGYSMDMPMRTQHFDRYGSPMSSDNGPLSPEMLGDCYHKNNHLLSQHHVRTTSMSDVQNFADHAHEQTTFIVEHPCAPSVYHDGYVAHDISVDALTDMTVHTPQESTVESPVLRQRRPAARTTRVSPATSRVSKRTKRSAVVSTPASDSEGNDDQAPQRPFHCPLAPYGCKSTFGSKNEWKRHLSTQHLRLEYWRCDECPASHGKKPNDFNRRDLFTQHVRRMHVQKMPQTNHRKGRGKPARDDDADQELANAAARCHRRLRAPPAKSICVICSHAFSGPNSWEERMEHLGRHFECLKKEHGVSDRPLNVESWKTDPHVEEWLVHHGILSRNGQLVDSAIDDGKD